MPNKREKIFIDKHLKKEEIICPCPLIMLSSGMRYRPDIFIPSKKTYIELSGSKYVFLKNKHKYIQFRKDGYKLLILDYEGKTFDETVTKRSHFMPILTKASRIAAKKFLNRKR